MTVGPDLLKAAEANSPDAIDMVSIWGLGFKAELGGSLAPGLWMHQGAQRVLQQTRPGVLYNDLNACNAYQNALAAAAQVKVPATFILGERDMMTPAKAGKTLAAATPNARTIVLPGAGHMMMAEAPDELLAALQQITTAARQASSPPDGYRSRATSHAQHIHPQRAADAVAIEHADQIVDPVDLDAIELDHDVARQQSQPSRPGCPARSAPAARPSCCRRRRPRHGAAGSARSGRRRRYGRGGHSRGG